MVLSACLLYFYQSRRPPIPTLFPTRRSSDLHGASRLGSNSLLDIIVFGRAAAHRVTETLRPCEDHAPAPETATERAIARLRSEEHTSELQSPVHLVCRLLLEKKNNKLCSDSS